MEYVQTEEKELTCNVFEGLVSNWFIQTAPKPVNGIYIHFNVSGLFDLRSPWEKQYDLFFDWLMEGDFATDVKDNVVCDSRLHFNSLKQTAWQYKTLFASIPNPAK